MEALLQSYNLTENAIKIYIEGLGKTPFTFSELKKLVPKLSVDDVKSIIDNLIEKKLILTIQPHHLKSFTQYFFIPPFAAVLNTIKEISKAAEDKDGLKHDMASQIKTFEENLYLDIENISQELIDVISNQDFSSKTTEILSEVEQNVKKFAHLILTNVIGLINPLKREAVVETRDIIKLINAINQKIEESEEIISNMFAQFKQIVGEMVSPNIAPEVDAFKTFIRNLVESIDKRLSEISLDPALMKTNLLEKAVSIILTEYTTQNKIFDQELYFVNSIEKIKDLISFLIQECKEQLDIIVPTIKEFIPLEEFELDYYNLESKTLKTELKPKKPVKTSPAISKTKKKEVIDKLEFTSRKVAELKGFELSHYIAEILSLISEINPHSISLESIQGWLNRLLIIRKHLDSNTQYLLLEDIEKWKKNYLKHKPKEEQPETESSEDAVEKKDDLKKKNLLKIRIISSEPHDNKCVLIINQKENIEYLRIKNNNVIGIVGDNSFLVLGSYEKNKDKSHIKINGFFTNFKPITTLLMPIFSQIIEKAKPPRDILINRGFNEIIEKINDYSGRKISKKLRNLVENAFEEEGISLNLLELKLLSGKLEKIYSPLNEEMKDYVVKELNKLNNTFSTFELTYPPEFRPPIVEEEIAEASKQELTLEAIEIEPLDKEKINNLFDMFLEKIEKLNGVEISEQIDKFIETIMNLQGYGPIIDWRDKLTVNTEILKDPIKEKIKQDFLMWKLGILLPIGTHEASLREGLSSQDIQEKRKVQQTDVEQIILEEEYISPGLTQEQFTSDDNLSAEHVVGKEEKADTSKVMRDEFDNIFAKLDQLTGVEISKKLQIIVNIILENEGYSLALKDIKDWISKLRMIRNPPEGELKEDFELILLKWKEKYVKEELLEENLDFRPTLDTMEDFENKEDNAKGTNLREKFDNLQEKASTINGDEISNELQEISDILLKQHGAVAINVIRQWISKLRSIKEPLEDKIRDDFIGVLETWKEKFTSN